MERRADIRLGILGGSTVENALRNILNLEKQIGTSPVSPKIQTNSVEIALDRLKAKFDQLIRGTQVRINLDAGGLHQTYETTTRLTRGMETYNGMVSKGAELWAAHGAAIAGGAAGIGLAGKVAFDWALKAEDRMDRIKIMTRGMSKEQASAMERRADIRLGILGGSTVENALRNILNLEKQIGASPVSPKIQTNSVEIALDRLKAKFDQLIRGTQVRINLDASGLHQTYETTTRLSRGMETYNGLVSKGAELWAAHGAAIAGVAAGIGLAGKVMERRADIRLGILGGSTVENALRNILNLEKQIGASPVSPKIQTNSVEIALDRLKAKFDQLIRGTQVRINLDASGLHQTYETTTRLSRGMETYNGLVSKGAELWAAHSAAIAGVAAGIGIAGKVAFDWALQAEDRMDRIKIMTRGMSKEQASAMEKWVSSGNVAWSSGGERISLLEQASMFGIRDKDAMEFAEGIENLYSKNADLFQELYQTQGPSDLFGSMTRGLMRGGTGKQGATYQIRKISAAFGMSPEQLFGDEFEEFKDQLAEKEEFSDASPDTILATARAMWIGKQGKLAQGEEDTGIDVEMFNLRNQMSSMRREGGAVFQPFFEAGLKATNAIISSMADIPIMGSSMSAGFVFASDAAGGVTAALNQMIGPLLAANMFLGQGKLAAYAQAAGMKALRAAHLAYAGGAYIAAAASRVLAAAMASTGIGALVVGLGLLVGWLLLTEDKMKKLSKAWEWVKSIGKTALKFMISPLAIFGEGISGHLLKMVNQNAYLQRIWETLQYVWDVLVNTWESIKKGVTSIYDEIGKPLHKLGEMLDKAFSWLFDKMGRIWDKFFETEEETAVESEEENAPIAEGTWGGPQFPTVQSAEELAKFYRINENAIYNNSLNGSSMLGSELAENMLINPLARVKMAAEYGLPRFGEEEAKPEAAVADVVPALEAFTEEQRKDAEAFIDAGHVLRDDDSGRVLRSVKEIENEIIAVKKGKEGRSWEDWVDNPNTPGLDAKMPGIWSSRGGVWDLLWSLTALSTTRNPNEDEIYHPPNAAETGLNPPKEPEKPVSPEQPETFDGGTYTIVRTGIDKYGNQIYGVDLQSVGRVADGFTSEEEANNWAKDDQAKRFVSAETGGTVGEGGLLDVHAKERIVNAQITSRADSALETLVKMLTGGGVEAGDANRGARQVSHTHNWYFPQSVSTIGGNINWSQMQYFIEQTMHRAERQYHGD